MEHGKHTGTKTRFQANVAAKLSDKNFASSIGPLLSAGYEWDLTAMSAKVD